MNDLLPAELVRWHRLEAAMRDRFDRYGYGELRTPLLEETRLFARSIGDETDIVGKEMYTFPDRKGKKQLSLRPEGTASAVRAYIQHSVHGAEPVTRWWYFGPMYRHERVQAGRYRQFYQVGAEALGSADPSLEAEVISLFDGFLRQDLGLGEVELQVNNLGDSEDRKAYAAALVAHLDGHLEVLCEDCRRRKVENPLRTLDCKVPGCQPVMEAAPRLEDHLGEAARVHFAEVLSLLDALGIAWVRNHRLVRGLDYYNRTCFEFVAGGLGAQNTVCAGGRYDGLVAQLGGPKTPAVGFAAGIERLVSLMSDAAPEDAPELVAVVPVGTEVFPACLRLVEELRREGLRVDFDPRRGSLKSQMRRADKLGARVALVIGEDELAAGRVPAKDLRLEGAEPEELALADLHASLRRWFKERR
ncbi:MAG: histidine--tRNA ligase [Deltaproteobacteria bacterium]|nr:histidine--tRNA ligase [Deltaproteobacteria bacterium]